jgi:hypothetical protein
MRLFQFVATDGFSAPITVEVFKGTIS